MWPSHHLTGTKIGRWTVGKRVGTKNGFAYLECTCDCGSIRSVVSQSLVNGSSVSCGCWSIEYKKERYTTHGLKTHPLYSVWLGMKTRCYNSKSYPYRNYGARGIKLSDEWANDFLQFYKDMADGYEPGLTIERINNNGNYEKSNCCWITRNAQTRNRRCSIIIDTLQGKLTVGEAAKIAGISWPAMYVRIKNKWPMENLLIPRSYRS